MADFSAAKGRISGPRSTFVKPTSRAFQRRHSRIFLVRVSRHRAPMKLGTLAEGTRHHPLERHRDGSHTSSVTSHNDSGGGVDGD
jgi:hypothetical protein